MSDSYFTNTVLKAECGNVEIKGILTAISAIINGVNINTTLTNILSRLNASEAT